MAAVYLPKYTPLQVHRDPVSLYALFKWCFQYLSDGWLARQGWLVEDMNLHISVFLVSSIWLLVETWYFNCLIIVIRPILFLINV